ncbi:helix-turn-helix domain-containing protein [Dysgonomonas sp.]|jgi:hypothetical protein|uniref:helix-turn-helix domain-containing protein n=1 Tax=Dysgonomonas sp. TaxID=1891233 RepID=UPI002CB5C5B9|nr:helix-turn-helix domain-containing protein [Dysgonomonas sp.]HMM03866.1 helix-turn-helix domain-containing protein [Dysgonomonas sp.]
MEQLRLIESKVFESIVNKVKNLAHEASALRRKSEDKNLEEWLDGQDVCLILNISPRTLQTYRDTGRLGFCQINHKLYYKAGEIDKLLKKNYYNNHKKK